MRLVWTEVYRVPHRDLTMHVEFVVLSSGNGTALTLSGNHIVYVMDAAGSKQIPAAARNVQVCRYCWQQRDHAQAPCSNEHPYTMHVVAALDNVQRCDMITTPATLSSHRSAMPLLTLAMIVSSGIPRSSAFSPPDGRTAVHVRTCHGASVVEFLGSRCRCEKPYSEVFDLRCARWVT